VLFIGTQFSNLYTAVLLVSDTDDANESSHYVGRKQILILGVVGDVAHEQEIHSVHARELPACSW